jgi:hypothetical protein
VTTAFAAVTAAAADMTGATFSTNDNIFAQYPCQILQVEAIKLWPLVTNCRRWKLAVASYKFNTEGIQRKIRREGGTGVLIHKRSCTISLTRILKRKKLPFWAFGRIKSFDVLSRFS